MRFLRAFLDTNDDESVNEAVTTIKDSLSKFSVELNIKIQQYWKIPHYTEVLITFKYFNVEDGFCDFINSLGEGWVTEQSNEFIEEALWTRDGTNYFVSDKVVWAHFSIDKN